MNVPLGVANGTIKVSLEEPRWTLRFLRSDIWKLPSFFGANASGAFAIPSMGGDLLP